MKVVITDGNRKYLSMVRGEIAFVERKERALVYDLEADSVQEQLAVVQTMFGGNWTWEPVGDTQCVDGLPRNEP